MDAMGRQTALKDSLMSKETMSACWISTRPAIPDWMACFSVSRSARRLSTLMLRSVASTRCPAAAMGTVTRPEPQASSRTRNPASA